MIICALKPLLPGRFPVVTCCGARRPASDVPVLAQMSFLLLLLNASVCHAAGFPAPSGKFTFDGKSYTETATFTNTSITNKSLYLNGEYFTGYVGKEAERRGKGYTAVFRPLVFDYRKFTAVVKLCPENISHGATLLVGGTSCRWFVMRAGSDGRIELSFNNFQVRHPVESLTVTNGQWLTLAITFDLQSRRVIIYANGTRADEVVLPEDFALDVMNDAKWKESDKVVTFTDYANGGTFQGFVAGLLTFNSILAPNQMRRLFPRN